MLKTLIKLARNVYPLAELINSGPLAEDGWFLSWHKKASIDGQGKPIPWITYPAIEFLSRRLPASIRVFEYGCGNSTLWWANRATSVVSIEHDAGWYSKMLPALPPNCSLSHIPLDTNGHYAGAISAYRNTFEIVFVDGRDRVNCLARSPEALTQNGIIILDNSDRINYRPGIEELFAKGWRQIEFVGYSPITSAKNETSIFYRRNNLLGL